MRPLRCVHVCLLLGRRSPPKATIHLEIRVKHRHHSMQLMLLGMIKTQTVRSPPSGACSTPARGWGPAHHPAQSHAAAPRAALFLLLSISPLEAQTTESKSQRLKAKLCSNKSSRDLVEISGWGVKAEKRQVGRNPREEHTQVTAPLQYAPS